MALDITPLPYGLRDVQLFAYSGGVPVTTGVDLPNSRTMSFAEAESFQDLRGDDGDVATHGSGPSVNWSLEAGGVPLEAIKVMYGGTIDETGVTPNQVKSYTKNKDDQRPYFRAEGQAISDSGGDFHVILFRCKATGDLGGQMADGAFWLSGSSGRALPLQVANTSPAADVGDVYRFVQNETATPIVVA